MAETAYTALAKGYDALIYDVDYKAWADYLLELLEDASRPIKRVLETGCGTGNLTMELKKRGLDMLASDVSASMLDEAAAKARKRGLQVRWILQDMRNIQVPPVDAVICALDGVNYIKQNQVASFFKSAYGVLKPGGILLFDISSAYKLRHVLGDKQFFDDGEEVTCLWNNQLKEDWVEMSLTLFYLDGDVYRRKDEAQRQYIHQATDLKIALQEAGFVEVQAFGFGTKERPKPEEQRIQFLAKKEALDVGREKQSIE